MTVTNSAFYLGTDPRDPRRLYWLDLQERRAHMAVFGATGSGKSNLLLDVIMQDLAAGRGCCLIDPKGDLVEDVLAALTAVPEERWPALAADVILLDPSDPDCRVAFNPLEVSSYGSPARQRQEMVSVFRKIWRLDDAQAPRLGLVLRRSLHLAMENGLTLTDVQRILTDDPFRASLLDGTDDDSLRVFWQHEFPQSSAAQLQWTGSTLTRIETLTDDPALRRLLGRRKSTFDFRRVMDEGKVLLISLSKGRLGQEVSSLLGGLLLAKLQMAAESRQEIWPPEARRPFYAFVDEFQNYATKSFEEMLAEARGYGLSLVMANQHLSQLDEGLRRAVVSNARIRIAFRVSHDDASVLAQELWRFEGDRVKDKELQWEKLGKFWLPMGYRYDYYSAGDETRQNRESLHYLPDRLFWLHVQGQPAPVLLRSVDVPRDRLAAARDRVRRFRRLLSSVHNAPSEPPMLPARTAPRTFEWAGRERSAVAAERQTRARA